MPQTYLRMSVNVWYNSEKQIVYAPNDLSFLNLNSNDALAISLENSQAILWVCIFTFFTFNL